MEAETRQSSVRTVGNKRVLVWMLLVCAGAFVLAFITGGIYSGWKAAHSGFTWIALAYAVLGLAFLWIPCVVGWKMIQARRKMGAWKMTLEMRIQRAAQCRRRDSINFNGGPYALLEAGIRWGRARAFDPSVSVPTRIGAWAMVVLYLAWICLFALVALVCVGVAFADDNTWAQTLLFLLLGVLSMVYPALWSWNARRRRRQGGYALRLDASEVDAITASWNAWNDEERAKPLSAKLGAAVGLLVILAAWTILRRHHTVPLFWLVLYSLWAPFYLWRVLGPRRRAAGDKQSA